MVQRANDFLTPLVPADLQPAVSAESQKKIARHVLKWSVAQATAVDLATLFVAEGAGRIVSVKAMTAGDLAGAGESMVVDVTIDGTSCLDSTITLNSSSTADTWSEATIDYTANTLALGSSVLIDLDYTAGGTPTPMTDTYVVVMYEYDQVD